MVSIGFADSAAGEAGTGVRVDCAAEIPAKSKNQQEAARILIEDRPLQDQFSNTLAISDAPAGLAVSREPIIFSLVNTFSKHG
jgi:hypothetical protein